MSRFPTLTSALVAALALSNLGGLCCPAPEEQDAEIVMKRGELEAELKACLEDDRDCVAFCDALLLARGVVDEAYGSIPLVNSCIVRDGSSPTPTVEVFYEFGYECVGGRRPAAETSKATSSSDPVIATLCQIAHLEATSVHAFVELARDLDRHGAPKELVARALASAADEVDHAGALAKLVKKRGHAVGAPRVAALSPRSIAELAEINAVEGCVRELYGAIVALHQSQNAADADVRDVFTQIAQDELRHAELAFAIDAWAMTKLAAADAVRVRTAKQRSLIELQKVNGFEDAVSRELGLPSKAAAMELARVAVLLHERSARRG